jgi:hypothetical protein
MNLCGLALFPPSSPPPLLPPAGEGEPSECIDTGHKLLFPRLHFGLLDEANFAEVAIQEFSLLQMLTKPLTG